MLGGALGWMEERRQRIASDEALTLAFFSSGAEPTRHVEALIAGAKSVANVGHRAIVFAMRGGRFARLSRLERGAISNGLEIVEFGGRDELDRLTASRFASFDVVVSPPHERSNWAASLGVPFLLVGPDIGPFSPRNRSLLLQLGVAAEIPSVEAAQQLAVTLADLRTQGHLTRMAEKGCGKSFRGFERSAEYLIAACEERSAGR